VVIMGVIGPARRSRKQLAAWSLTIVTLALLAATLVLAVLNTRRTGVSRLGLDAALSAAVLLYAASGRLIAGRRPDNAIGWLLASIGLALTTSMVAEQYAVYGLATAPGAVPAPKAVGCVAAAAASVTVVLLFFVVLLFPDGHLPSPRWRPVLWAMIVVFIGWGSQEFQAGTTISGGISGALGAVGAEYPNPVSFLPRHGWYSDLLLAIFVLAIFTAIAVVASVFARRRHATPERRQQLRWLGYVGALTIVWILSIGLANGLAKGAADSWLGTALWSLTVLTPVVGIPLACVVAVLRYRLYDLDRIISRTVAYAVVTGLLIGVYAGLVLLATEVIGITSPVAVAGATLAAAALFGPLRSRVQQRVDHRFNRARYDAERLLAAFAARLTEELDADTVTEDLARSVHTALEPAHVSIWLSER
jgi:MFS family permease